MANEKEIKALEAKIAAAMKNIKDGTQNPKVSGIGKMLNLLKELDEPAYEKVFAEYKPISKEFFEKYAIVGEVSMLKTSAEYLKIKQAEEKKAAALKKAAIDAAEALGARSGGGGMSDDEITSGPRNLAAKEKVKVKKELKAKVPKAAKPVKEKGNRDLKSYTFNGETYGKGPLVLALVKEHVRLNPKITFDGLKKAFPDVLMKGYGVFQCYDVAMEKSKKTKRYFLNESQVIHLKSENTKDKNKIAVCSQIADHNVAPILAQCVKLGYTII